MPAPYDIRAYICGHHLRFSTTLPRSNTTVDHDIYYCSYCESSRQTSQNHQWAEDDFNLYKDKYRRNGERVEARMAYDTARANLANEQLCREELDEYERKHGQRQHTDRKRQHGDHEHQHENRKRQHGDHERHGDRELRDRESALPASVPARRGRSARFDDSQKHTGPSEYRHNREYWRPGEHYTPGRHSDRSGEGYLDTSRPPSKSPSPYPGRGLNHTRAATPGPSDRTKVELDEEAEEARIREIRGTLNKYSDRYGGKRY